MFGFQIICRTATGFRLEQRVFFPNVLDHFRNVLFTFVFGFSCLNGFFDLGSFPLQQIFQLLTNHPRSFFVLGGDQRCRFLRVSGEQGGSNKVGETRWVKQDEQRWWKKLHNKKDQLTFHA